MISIVCQKHYILFKFHPASTIYEQVPGNIWATVYFFWGIASDYFFKLGYNSFIS